MSPAPPLRRLWQWIMAVGEYPGEPPAQAGKRRIVVGYMVLSVAPRILFGSINISTGFAAAGAVDMLAAVLPAMGLIALKLKPHWYVAIVNALLAAILVENLIPTVMRGGLVAEPLMAFGILAVVGALIALGRRAALIWFGAYLVSLALAVVLPELIDPLYDVQPAAAEDVAGVLVGVTVFVYAGMAYFVRQRDRFQQESDDLLHNILPNEIASRLKVDTSMIADDFPAASVMFADVVGFTPMSANMDPPQLVGLLNSVFSAFDGFVEELGLEKIKTVGDEYMAAAGVPVPRPDHAVAIAELALRIRDHVAATDFDGHRLQLRIGINSGAVVAGIIGRHKFSYDMWGDTVNTASRMESSGIPGQIQVSSTTHALLADTGYSLERRGSIEVKGKGEMQTWLLVGRAG